MKSTTRLNLNVPSDFYRELKADCASRGITITVLVTRLLLREMNRRRKATNHKAKDQ